MLQEELEAVLQNALWDLNTSETRERLRQKIAQILIEYLELSHVDIKVVTDPEKPSLVYIDLSEEVLALINAK